MDSAQLKVWGRARILGILSHELFPLRQPALPSMVALVLRPIPGIARFLGAAQMAEVFISAIWPQLIMESRGMDGTHCSNGIF